MELDRELEQTATGIIHLKRVRLSNCKQKLFVTVMKRTQLQENGRRQDRDRYCLNMDWDNFVLAKKPATSAAKPVHEQISQVNWSTTVLSHVSVFDFAQSENNKFETQGRIESHESSL